MAGDDGGRCAWCGKIWAAGVPADSGCPFCQAADWKNGPDKSIGLTNDYVVKEVGWQGGKVFLGLSWPLNANSLMHLRLEEQLLKQIREAAGKMGLRVHEIGGMGIVIDRDEHGAVRLAYLGRNKYAPLRDPTAV